MPPTQTPKQTPAQRAEQAVAMLVRETRRAYGPIEHWPGGRPLAEDRRIFLDDEFALRTDSGYAFHYVPGRGVRIERDDWADPGEEELWLNGSVYAAIACLNGLYPLHASAVAHGGQVFAFTGPSGAGKSTLVAGLGQRGLPMFCDDTLLLCPGGAGEPAIALPGHKRLKLTDHALGLTGARRDDPVGSDTGKHYATPASGTVAQPMPLYCLVFLEEGPEPDWQPITGAARFALLADDHYTQDFYASAQQPDRAALFALRAHLASTVTMARLIRPRSEQGFAKSLDLAEKAIRKMLPE